MHTNAAAPITDTGPPAGRVLAEMVCMTRPFVLLILCAWFSAWGQDQIQLYQGTTKYDLRAVMTRPPYVHLDDFLNALQIEAPTQEAQSLILDVNGRRLELDTAARKAHFNRSTVPFLLRIEPDGRYARVDTLAQVFSYLLGRQMIYEPTSKSLHLPESRDLLVKVRTHRVDDAYRIIISYSSNLEKPRVEQGGNKIVVRIGEPSLVLDRSELTFNEALVSLDLFTNLPDGSSDLVFTTSALTREATVERFNPSRPRTVIKLFGNYAPLAATDQPAASGIRRIAIDPGHGGKDKGAVGPTGLEEKNVTLHLAGMLKEYLEREGKYEVVLTRKDDTLVSLKTRTGIANHFKADLFLSIHLNAIPTQNATGSETYYLTLGAGDAQDDPHYEEFDSPDENGGTVPEDTDDDLSLMLWDMAQAKHIDDSFRVARYIQESLNILSGTRNRGVKQAGLKVLKGATMPAVLIEVAFISNRQEEKKLKSIVFKEQIVQAIGRAIAQYDTDVIRRSQNRNGTPAEEGLE